MTLFKEKLDLIKEGFANQLQSFLDDETVKSIRIVGSKKNKSTPELPALIVIADTFNVIKNRGSSDIWEGTISIAFNTLEMKDDENAINQCETVISQIEDNILVNPSLGVEGVISTLPLGIEVVPYPFGKNKNVYGSGAKFIVKFMLPRYRTD